MMYFLVHASSPKLLGRNNFKFCRCIDYMMLRVLSSKSEDQNEMPHTAAFNQGLPCLL